MAKIFAPAEANLRSNSDSLANYSLPCEYCANLTFKHIHDFIRHLREKHCSQEGGSFVCRYGYNQVCSSLPVEGVSDKDYIAHAAKHAANMQQQQQLKKSNGQMLVATSGAASSTGSASTSWSVYSAAQNLPAVLNDPYKGKQSNFLTKTWGDSFIEKTDIPKSLYIPEINEHHFDSYRKRIIKFDFNSIPRIFINPHLDLSKRQNFDEVFPFSKEGLLGDGKNIVFNVKQMQEKLTHYLDIVEVRIAEQVASKSQAFFHAMTSHDVLMEQLTETLTVLKALRQNIHSIDNNIVKSSLHVFKLERARSNHLLVLEKLKLIATVHQSQPMIQSLLSTPDYVAALDVISTTQEILAQELKGIYGFRHLSSQLTEMEKVINKMLHTEFERYATADLNRPLNGDFTVLDGDKLVSIISGLLRQKHFQFIDSYKEEAMTTVRAITKQRIIEALADSDCCSDQQAAALEVGGLSLTERLKLLDNSIQALTSLLYRIKAVHNVMKDTANSAACKSSTDRPNESMMDRLLTDDDHERVITKLNDMLASLCDYCHERLGNLVSASPNENEKEKLSNDTNSSSNKSAEKDAAASATENFSDNNKSWLSDRATMNQVCKLANLVEKFTETCETLCGKQCLALRSAFKAQASKFVQKFHSERKIKLSHVLDSERWKQAEVPPEFQALITYIHQNESFPYELSQTNVIRTNKIENFMYVGNEKFAIVGTVLLLIQIIHEYCSNSKETKENARDVALRLATQEEKRRKSDPHDSREKSLIVLGSREVVKDIVHVWEIGHLTPSLVSAAMKGCCLSHSPHHTTVLLVLDLGKPETLWNSLEDCLEALHKGMEMSYPRELIEQVLNEKLRGLAERSGGGGQQQQPVVDEMREPFPLRLCLVGGRYDEFRGTDADDREFMGRALRAAAHALAASLHYHSAKDAQLLRRSKDMLSNYGFKGQSPKTTVIDHEKPLSVAAGADSFDSIELYDRPAATAALSLEEIKRIYVTRFPQRARDQEDKQTSGGGNYDYDELEHLANDESFAEPIIDRLVLQREETTSSIETRIELGQFDKRRRRGRRNRLYHIHRSANVRLSRETRQLSAQALGELVEQFFALLRDDQQSFVRDAQPEHLRQIRDVDEKQRG
ncbi:unnamed protein product [Trichogramma brassicae]|uniref:Vacuolar protein sorting-associated protein 54 N-terminal domain-containing protein n=1 Tax=Trichogramma brassicae TaxID=86971 RepID=A0A6H5J4E7_9HYME|nr:unnamed protein product [Trichogramma brassicae]